MARRFDDDSERSNPSRALQVYLVLIGNAMRRQTTTYNELAHAIGYGNARHVMGDRLGPIMYWCQQNDLPPLTSIVVREDTGLPGAGFVSPAEVPAEQQRVFNFDWYSIIPPTVDELREALKRGRAAQAA
jgi:putative restriction endonuclease